MVVVVVCIEEAANAVEERAHSLHVVQAVHGEDQHRTVRALLAAAAAPAASLGVDVNSAVVVVVVVIVVLFTVAGRRRRR